MLKTKYHPSVKGVILAEGIFPDKEVPLIDLRNLELPSKGTYSLYFRENCFIPYKGVFDYDSEKKQYFFKTEEGRVLTFEKIDMLTRALGECLLKLENSDKIIMEKLCLDRIVDYWYEAVPGAHVSDLVDILNNVQKLHRGIIKLN